MGLFLGIDGGGSTTRACLASEEGRPLGEGKSGVSNYHHASREVVRENLHLAVAEAFHEAGLKLAPVEAVFLGMAGVISPRDQAEILSLARELNLGATIDVDHDIRIALTGGLAGEPGIALIAGTGSSCYGKNRDGQCHQCGGWGSLADDAGSGSWMGQQALRMTVRMCDGRFPETRLKKLVFDFLGIRDPRDFSRRIHIEGLSREEMATLAPLIIQALESGDGAAEVIVDSAISELTEMVGVTANLLEMDAPAVVLAGGLALSGPPFQTILTKAILARMPKAQLKVPVLNPTRSAVLEALRMGGIPVGPAIIKQLKV